MATNTYVALDLKTVTSAVSSVTFTSIPSTYTDLVLVINAQASTVGQVIEMQYNNDTSSNYSMTELYGNGTSPGSFRRSSISSLQTSWNIVNFPDLNFGNAIIHLMNYSNTTTYKTVLSRTNAPSATYGGTVSSVGLWRSTSAISTLKVFLGGGNFAVGSTFSLYGIRAEGVSPAAKATGGAIYSDSTYFYHVFSTTGTFTPTQSLTADILVVAGGGGGGPSAGGGTGGGGGGAGGLLTYTSQSLTATGYTCTVGAGGNGGASGGATIGTSGTNSQFGALTASVGGGRGAMYSVGSAGNGGSGGGATYDFTTPGTGTSGQGYAGGNSGGTNWAGGGGGAGGVGGDRSGTIAGSGGVGATSSFINAIGTATGTGQLVSSNYYFAGGGGGGAYNVGTGGTPGYGGGGTGANASGTATAGLTNTGGGGAGAGGTSGNDRAAGAGGSGVIIVRYAK